MSSLLVESPGLQTTVQDLGREGYGPKGISPSGAADALALRLGNLLVGNEANTGALEMTLMGGKFVFPEGAVIALTGADFGATLDGKPAALWTPHAVLPGVKLATGATRDYARCYLSITGGVRVPAFLGSASTHLMSGLGGFHGRALRAGDVLEIGAPTKNLRRRKIAAKALQAWKPMKNLRVTEGPQADWFAEAAGRALLKNTFRVSEESDRLGLRLEGPMLGARNSGEMITEGVTLGAIQVTPSGQAIILFVEQQTSGGYPKIANVIGTDMHSVGQLRPRDEVRFEAVSLTTARTLWIEQQLLLSSPEELFA